jgi:hypothetical protein
MAILVFPFPIISSLCSLGYLNPNREALRFTDKIKFCPNNGSPLTHVPHAKAGDW